MSACYGNLFVLNVNIRNRSVLRTSKKRNAAHFHVGKADVFQYGIRFHFADKRCVIFCNACLKPIYYVSATVKRTAETTRAVPCVLICVSHRNTSAFTLNVIAQFKISAVIVTALRFTVVFARYSNLNPRGIVVHSSDNLADKQHRQIDCVPCILRVDYYLYGLVTV